MVRVKFLLFGYREIAISVEDTAAVSSLFLRSGIESTASPDGVIFISESDFIKARNILESGYEYSYSETKGLFGYLKAIRCKRGLIAGGVISLFLLIFLSNLVWDIRIDGNEQLSSAEIRQTLSECGFDIGSNWFSVDRSEIETEFLRRSEKLAWININRRGTVAYIEVIENDGEDSTDRPLAPTGYANIIAGESCVIEEITVKRGSAMVKAGDAVKKGDILISGVLPQGGFCYAEGEVVARLADSISVEVSREYEKCLQIDEVLIETDVKIFNFDINIFKKYGNSYYGCDIIEDVKVFSLFGSAPLPVSILRKYVRSCVYEMSEYTDDELVSVASQKLRALTLTELEGRDLLRIRTYGEFTDTGYLMRSDIVYLTEIGQTLEFTVN